MKSFSTALFKGLGIFTLTVSATTVVVIVGLGADFIVDKYFGIANATTVDNIRFLAMLIASVVVGPTLFYFVRQIVQRCNPDEESAT
jgi:hypothetical protein